MHWWPYQYRDSSYYKRIQNREKMTRCKYLDMVIIQTNKQKKLPYLFLVTCVSEIYPVCQFATLIFISKWEDKKPPYTWYQASSMLLKSSWKINFTENQDALTMWFSWQTACLCSFCFSIRIQGLAGMLKIPCQECQVPFPWSPIYGWFFMEDGQPIIKHQLFVICIPKTCEIHL